MALCQANASLHELSDIRISPLQSIAYDQQNWVA
jgi:hypothetical protein